MTYELQLVPRVTFGEGARRQWIDFRSAGPVLAVCGRHAERKLRAELAGAPVEIYSGVRPEPELEDVAKVRTAGRRIGARTIVGIGGGSVLDVAKAAACLLPEDDPVEDFFYGRRIAAPRRTGLILLPTTAGTGAEVTANAVLLDPETRVKQSLRSPGMAADWAIVDPELTFDCPPEVTAASGFDALTQAIEAFLSIRGNAVSAALAKSAAQRLFGSLTGAMRNEPAARRLAAEGSLLGAMAFAQSGLGAVHGVAHPAGSVWHVPHGVACAILLPPVFRRNLTAAAGPAAELAAALGCAGAEALATALESLRRELGLPENFGPYRPRREDFAFIVKNCRSGSMKCNPRSFTDAEVAEILEEVCR